uniref:Uncharacterized protein n=1 Tax=Phlebotomus papatasi TaxID=29031 RepID=A0A1B0GQ73_PHLPP
AESSHSALNSSLDFRECLWAAENPEVQKSCFLARVCELEPPKRCQVEAILQEGPTCEFITINMILHSLPVLPESQSKEIHCHGRDV